MNAGCTSDGLPSLPGCILSWHPLLLGFKIQDTDLDKAHRLDKWMIDCTSCTLAVSSLSSILVPPLEISHDPDWNKAKWLLKTDGWSMVLYYSDKPSQYYFFFLSNGSFTAFPHGRAIEFSGVRFPFGILKNSLVRKKGGGGTVSSRTAKVGKTQGKVWDELAGR